MGVAIAVVVLVVLLLWAAFRLWMTARRLDRLHQRTEAAWYACEESLARRIVAARALAATGLVPADVSQRLRSAATAADRADRAGRVNAEERLAHELAVVAADQRGGLAEELADAQERVQLAAQFYNDAVRDTRALRASWFTRFFRLAGHARLPEFFVLGSSADEGQKVSS